MSSITILKVKLKNVNAEILKQVVEQLCKEHGGEMTNTIHDFYGNVTRVELGFKCRAHPRGVGFTVEKGQVQIKGDFYQNYSFQNQVQKQLVQNYTAQAHVAALRQMGYQTQTQKVGEKVVIRAYTW